MFLFSPAFCPILLNLNTRRIKGDGIGLHELNEQLFYQCMKKIQDKVSLEEFFGVPDDSSDEPNAPDPAEGWHNNTGGELVD